MTSGVYIRTKPAWNKGLKASLKTREKLRISHLGKKMSLITRKRMSEARMGKTWKSSKPNWNKGKKLSEETKKKISISRMGKAAGENNTRWKGGISKHKGYAVFNSRRRKIRIKGNGGHHTLTEWENLKKKYNYMCLCCKKYEPEIRLTADHIVPIIKGGTNDISNLQPLCMTCNHRKFVKTINYLELYELNNILL